MAEWQGRSIPVKNTWILYQKTIYEVESVRPYRSSNQKTIGSGRGLYFIAAGAPDASGRMHYYEFKRDIHVRRDNIFGTKRMFEHLNGLRF